MALTVPISMRSPSASGRGPSSEAPLTRIADSALTASMTICMESRRRKRAWRASTPGSWQNRSASGLDPSVSSGRPSANRAASVQPAPEAFENWSWKEQLGTEQLSLAPRGHVTEYTESGPRGACLVGHRPFTHSSETELPIRGRQGYVCPPADGVSVRRGLTCDCSSGRSGRVPEWPNGADCKSAGLCLRGFESLRAHSKSKAPGQFRGFVLFAVLGPVGRGLAHSVWVMRRIASRTTGNPATARS